MATDIDNLINQALSSGYTDVQQYIYTCQLQPGYVRHVIYYDTEDYRNNTFTVIVYYSTHYTHKNFDLDGN